MPTVISGTDIQQWAERVDAPAILPELMRRLILATTQPRSIDFRADGGTRYGGWDGTVACANADSAFCPQGLSSWELSTEAGVAKKLESDYKKRHADAGTSYVAVTARRFPKKKTWAAQKKGARTWADVRVIDADDLSAWLADAPAVAVWFASEHLGRPVDDISTPDEFLNAWSNQTRPRLPRELLLVGSERKRAAQQVVSWTASTPARLTVSGDTRDEALRFVVAGILASPDAEALAARMLIVRSERALRWAERQQRSLILIPTLDAAALLTSNHHYVALAVDREGATRPDATVSLVPYSLVENELSRVGIADAPRLARESGGSLPALVRLCGASGRPAWAVNPSRASLGLLLAGEWSGDVGDMTAVAALTASTTTEIESLCVRLSRCPDPPLRRHRETFAPSTWRWSSPKDAWTTLSPDLTDAILDEFSKSALEILGEEKAVFTLPKQQRFATPPGKPVKRSSALRMGIARSLARLSLSDGMLTGATRRGSTLATFVVRTLLRPEWIAWASLADVLPVLAEAAPEMFLDALGRSIDAGDQGVCHLFAEESDFSSPHTGVLWALERLGWASERMPRVVRALVRLSEQDPGGRVSNRPSASLTSILSPFRPSTNANVDARIATLRKLHAYCPGGAWALTLRLAGLLRGMVVMLPSASLEFLSDPCEGATVSGEEFARFGRAAVDLLLEHVGTNRERWSELIKVRVALEQVRPDFFETLERHILRGEVVDPDQLLWSDVRLALHQAHHRNREPSDPEIAQLQRIYDALTPADPVRAIAWLFNPPMQIPEHFPNGWEQESARLQELRREAVTGLYAADDLGPLRALSALISQPTDLGVLLAQLPFATALEPVILDLTSDEWAGLRPGFFVVLYLTRGIDWAERYLRNLLSHDRLSEATQTARMLPWKPETWDVLERISPALRAAYWRSRPMLYPQDRGDAERFVSELMTVGAYAQSFSVASHYAKDLSSDLLMRVLDSLSRSPDEVAQAGAAGWGAQQVFERLNRDSSIADNRLLGLELRYLPWLSEPFGGTQDLRIFRALEHEPEFFVQLVSMLYRKQTTPEADEAEGETESTELSVEQKQAAARNAYTVLEAWDGYPGRDAEGDERTRRLSEWSTSVLELTKQSGRAGPGESALAAVLARVPAGLYGVWPCETARSLIEQGRQRFRDSLSTAKWNMRGVWSKGMFEGGKQEQAIAAPYREGAARLRLTHPETAAFLDRIVASYENDAKLQDEGARDGRIDAGIDEQHETGMPDANAS